MEEQERQAAQTQNAQFTSKEPVLPLRPPKTWRERIFHSLPYYTGPYNVGYLEVELPAEQPQTFSRIKRNSRHALQLDTVLFSVYYPTNADPKTGARVPWLPRPRVPTCHGYAKFFNIPNTPVTAYMAATCMFTKLPAFRNARVAQASPSASASGEARGEGAGDGQDADDQSRPKFPVVMFSHGLGGSRTMYSTVCGDLASYGFVVVAMEHRDGSGARSYVNVPPDRDSPELSQDERGRRSVDDEAAELKKSSNNGNGGEDKDKSGRRTRNYMVDYIFPKDNAQDTAPHNAKGVDRELRGAQIEMRLAEMEEAYKVLEVINAGDPDDRIKNKNLRKKPNRGSSSKGLEGIDWTDWKGRLSLENVTAMGHSFGGATTVQILRLDKRFPWIGQGILLDAWGPATPEITPGQEGQATISKPLLSIGSEAFMHWQDNYDKLTEIGHEAKQGGALCWMLTVRGSTHLSQTDFAVLYPRWMSLLMKTLINPLRGIYLTIAPTLEFLKIVLPPAQTSCYDTSAWVDEGLLRNSLRPHSQIDLEHKPDDKWIAARLKIRHEFKLRLQRWWNTWWSATTTLLPSRGGGRKGDGGGGAVPEDVPRDKEGRPLFGLKTWGPGEEMWVHLCPSKAEVERQLERGREGEDGEEEEEGGEEQKGGDRRRPYPIMRCPTM